MERIPIETESNAFRAVVFDDGDAVSVICIDDDEDGQPVDGDSIRAWPTPAQIEQAVGFRVRFLDSGDHPTRCEAVYRRRHED